MAFGVTELDANRLFVGIDRLCIFFQGSVAISEIMVSRRKIGFEANGLLTCLDGFLRTSRLLIRPPQIAEGFRKIGLEPDRRLAGFYRFIKATGPPVSSAQITINA